MADDTEQLIVQLEAKINDFEKNMAKASQTADQSFSTIEARAQKAAASLQAQMGKAAAGVAGVFSNFGSSFLSSAGISGLGLTALFATAVKLNGELAKIPGLAREAGVSTDKLQEIKFAANVKGISDDDFTASMRTSLGLLDEAQRQVNSLSRLFNANGLSIKDSNGNLLTFDQLLNQAATLMAGTASEQGKIKVADMLGLSKQWVSVLRDGPAAFQATANEAISAGAVIDQQTVQRAKDFDKAWTESIVRFKAGFTEGLADLADAFGNFWNDIVADVPGASFISGLLDKWAGGLKSMTLPELEDALQRSVEQGVGNIEISRIQAEIDQRLGKTPIKVTVTPEVADTVIPQEHQKSPFDSAVYEANKRIAAVDAETASIGENTDARERAKLVAQLEEAAKRSNTEAGFQNATVTDQQRDKINQLADAMQNAVKSQQASHTQLMQFAVDGQNFTKQFDQFAISGFGSFENSFAEVVTGAKSAKDAFSDMATSILSDLTKMILRMEVTGPLAAALGGALGGGSSSGYSFFGSGGFLGGLFAPTHHTGYAPGDRITGRLVSPSLFVNAPRFHTGIGPGETAAVLRTDESVLTPAQMRQLAPIGQGGGAVSVTINNAPAGTTATATATRDGTNGQMKLDVWLARQIDDVGAASITSGQSSMNGAIERRYGLTPKL